MSTTFTLKINDLRVIQITDQPNTVCQIDYEYVGVDDNNKSSRYIGSERLNTDDIESFVAFEELTEATVVGWLEGMWSDTHYDHMQEQINARIAAPVVSSMRNPWEPEGTPDGAGNP